MGSVLVHAAPSVEKLDASTSVQLPIHASVVAGDIVIAGWSWNSATLPGQASGWTMLDEIGSTVDTLAPSCSLHRKTVTGTDVTNGYVTMAVHTSIGSGAALCLHDFTTTQDFTLVPLDKTATSANFPFGTPTVSMDGVVEIYIVGQNTVQADVMTPPSNFTEISDRVTGRNHSMGYRLSPPAGAQSAITVVSGATTRGVGLLAAFRPTVSPNNAKFDGFC